MFILFFVFIFDTFCVSRKSFILILPYCSSHKLEIIIALTQRALWVFYFSPTAAKCTDVSMVKNHVKSNITEK